jgi:L-cysteate sulfo-lyase
MSMPIVALAPEPTPVQPLTRLAEELGPDCPRLFIKRDDLLSFGLGGNKVRKMEAIAAEARAMGADTLITCGAIQSNHARVTAAAGAALGFHVVLVLNVAGGRAPSPLTGNARLDQLFGADVRFVESREARQPAMEDVAGALRAKGRRPFIVPVGGSTPAGALGFARGLVELAKGDLRPDVIVHASSSGATQAGLIAGCALFGLRARVIGVSADDPAETLRAAIGGLLDQMATRLGAKPQSLGMDTPIDVDDGFVGAGYGIPAPAATAATESVARREGIVLDPVYTAKAMSGLFARIRAGEFSKDETILFWHTGGLVF